MKTKKVKECKGIVSCSVNCGGVMCQNKPRKTDINKPREVVLEEAIQRMKALEARVKRLEEEGESVEYVTPPKNNGLVKEKNESFWSKFKKFINIRP